MCEYCAYNKNFWGQVVERAQSIRILTPSEVADVERQLAEKGSVNARSLVSQAEEPSMEEPGRAGRS